MRAAIYSRVSTPGQEEEGTSLESQDAACRAYCEERSYTLDSGHVYRDVKSGAQLWERPQLQRLLDAMKRREIDVIVAYAVDRLSREITHFFSILADADRAGCRLEFVTQSFDASPTGLLLQSVQAFVGAQERAAITERTIRGKKERIKQGKVSNAGREMYGYRRDKEAGIRHVYEPEAAIVRMIFSWVANEGMPLRAVAIKLNEMGIPTAMGREWAATTIRLFLKNPAYKGMGVAWRFQETQGRRRPRAEEEWLHLPDGVVPQIVIPLLWDRANERLSTNHGEWKRNQAREILWRGHVLCAKCGLKMIPHQTPRVLYWRCSSGAGAYYSDDYKPVPCGASMPRDEHLSPKGWEQVRLAFKDTSLWEEALERAEGADQRVDLHKLAELKVALERISAQDRRWLGAYGEGAIEVEELKDRRGALQKQKAQFEKALATLEIQQAEEENQVAQLAGLLPIVARIAPHIELMKFQERRDLLARFQIHLLAGDGDVRLSVARWFPVSNPNSVSKTDFPQTAQRQRPFPPARSTASSALSCQHRSRLR